MIYLLKLASLTLTVTDTVSVTYQLALLSEIDSEVFSFSYKLVLSAILYFHLFTHLPHLHTLVLCSIYI